MLRRNYAELIFKIGILIIPGGADKLKELLQSQESQNLYGIGLSTNTEEKSATNTRQHSSTQRDDNVSADYTNT